MTFLNRLFHKFKGAANDLLDKNQDLGQDSRQTLRELEDNLVEADATFLEVRAQAEVLKGKQEKAELEVAKWLKAASNAAGKDDDLARECLVKKAAATASLKLVEDEIDRFQPTVDAIQKHIEQLRAQKESMSNQVDLIGVRSDVADVELKAASILSGVGNSGVSLAGTEDALAKKEARARAAVSITDERQGNNLEARVAALDAVPSIEDELAALKAAK